VAAAAALFAVEGINSPAEVKFAHRSACIAWRTKSKKQAARKKNPAGKNAALLDPETLGASVLLRAWGS